MAKKTKKYVEAASKVEKAKLYEAKEALCDLPSNKHHASPSPSVYLFRWHLTDVWCHYRLPNPLGSCCACLASVCSCAIT